MAEIENIGDTKALRKELATCEEPMLIGNMIMTHGALNAVRHLIRYGASQTRAVNMEEQLEENIGVIEQVAAERGISLEIKHLFGPKPYSPGPPP